MEDLKKKFGRRQQRWRYGMEVVLADSTTGLDAAQLAKRKAKTAAQFNLPTTPNPNKPGFLQQGASARHKHAGTASEWHNITSSPDSHGAILFEAIAPSDRDAASHSGSSTVWSAPPKLAVAGRKARCALCTSQFDAASVRPALSMKKLIQLRRSWGVEDTGSKCKAASFQYSVARLCVFCSQMVGADSTASATRASAARAAAPSRSSSAASARAALRQKSSTATGISSVGDDADAQLSRSMSSAIGLESAGDLLALGPIEETNLALNRPAHQSSTSDGRDAGLAVDGGKNRDVRSCCRTRREAEAWWEVDLEAEYPCKEIRVVQREVEKGRSYRLAPFWVMMSTAPVGAASLRDAQRFSEHSVRFDAADAASEDGVVSWKLPSVLFGRYVRVQVEGVKSLQMAQLVVLKGQIDAATATHRMEIAALVATAAAHAKHSLHARTPTNLTLRSPPRTPLVMPAHTHYRLSEDIGADGESLAWVSKNGARRRRVLQPTDDVLLKLTPSNRLPLGVRRTLKDTSDPANVDGLFLRTALRYDLKDAARESTAIAVDTLGSVGMKAVRRIYSLLASAKTPADVPGFGKLATQAHKALLARKGQPAPEAQRVDATIVVAGLQRFAASLLVDAAKPTAADRKRAADSARKAAKDGVADPAAGKDVMKVFGKRCDPGVVSAVAAELVDLGVAGASNFRDDSSLATGGDGYGDGDTLEHSIGDASGGADKSVFLFTWEQFLGVFKCILDGRVEGVSDAIAIETNQFDPAPKSRLMEPKTMPLGSPADFASTWGTFAGQSGRPGTGAGGTSRPGTSGGLSRPGTSGGAQSPQPLLLSQRFASDADLAARPDGRPSTAPTQYTLSESKFARLTGRLKDSTDVSLDGLEYWRGLEGRRRHQRMALARVAPPAIVPLPQHRKCAVCDVRFPVESLSETIMVATLAAFLGKLGLDVGKYQNRLESSKISMYHRVNICGFCAQFFDPAQADGLALTEMLTGAAPGEAGGGPSFTPFFDTRFPDRYAKPSTSTWRPATADDKGKLEGAQGPGGDEDSRV